MTAIKLMTMNLHKGFAPGNRRFVLPELREAVRSLHADIVCLQEVLGSHELHALKYKDWPGVPQYEFLADTIWGHFSYGQNAVYPKGHHGNALLSKFPIVAHRNHDASVSKRERRGLLHCHVDTGSTALHVVCVHLALLEADRQRQYGLLSALLDEHVPPDAPLIVAGDFNDWRQRADAALRGRGLAEAFVQLHGRAARSFPARWPVLRLDRVYVRNLTVRGAAVHSARPWSHLSDHVPLTVEVTS